METRLILDPGAFAPHLAREIQGYLGADGDGNYEVLLQAVQDTLAQLPTVDKLKVEDRSLLVLQGGDPPTRAGLAALAKECREGLRLRVAVVHLPAGATLESRSQELVAQLGLTPVLDQSP